MLQDLRTAVRAILKDRWLAAAVVFALALGIEVKATVFTLVNAVLIRGLPFHDSASVAEDVKHRLERGRADHRLAAPTDTGTAVHRNRNKPA